MEQILSWVFEFKEVLILLAAGAIFPAVATLFVKVLSLPGIRNAVGGFCELGGAWFSAFLTKRFPKRGEDMEDMMQDFLQNVLVNRFFKGLDRDDLAK